MCGILGVVGPGAESLTDQSLVDALDLLRHRGPDAGAVWRDRNVALGHRRLAIIDLAARAEQPMSRGALKVVFNGEIYNFRSIRRELEQLGHGFITTSDTEVLAAAWQQWGRGCLNRLEGMFAFAIWDGAAQTLTLVRDRFGEKPLFWLRSPAGIMFASEPPPLLRLVGGGCEIDPAALGLYFSFSYIPAPWGIFKDLRQLPPGSWLARRADGVIEEGRYYSVRPTVRAVPTPLRYLDAVSELRRRLTEAVRVRLEAADVPVATLLSGGLDSSIITTITATVYDRPLTAYTLGFPNDPEFDESDHARAVAARLPGITHQVVPATEDKILDFSDQVFDRLGEPFADASLLPTSYLCAQIEEKVALGGDAADELFAGYGIYPAIVRGAALPGLLRRLLLGVPRHRNPHAIVHPRLRGAALFHRHLRADPVASYLSWREYAGAEMLRALGLDLSARESIREQIGAVGSGALRDIQEVDMAFNLPNDMLKKVDYAAMYHSLEVRLPYLDSDLVRWVLQLPDDYRLGGGVRKRILRDAFAADLPARILTRRKMGFLLPIRRWFRAGRLRDQLEGLLERQTRFDSATIRGAIDRHVSGAEDNSVLLWALYVYLRWSDNVRRWARHAVPPQLAATMTKEGTR